MARVRLGVVESIVRTGHVVVRLESSKPPRLGVTVAKGDQAVGRLVDVIGPVDKPWGVIRLRPGSKVEPGEILYYMSPRRSDRRARSRSRGRGRKQSRMGRVREYSGHRRRNKGVQRNGRSNRRRGNRSRG